MPYFSSQGDLREHKKVFGKCASRKLLKTLLVDRLDTEHSQVTPRHLPQKLSLTAAVSNGSMTNVLPKKRAEGAQALKSDFETDLSHAQAAHAQQLFRLLDSFLN